MDLENRIWNFIHQEIAVLKNFEKINEEFWKYFIDSFGATYRIKDLNEYYEKNMKSNLFRAKMNPEKILEIYKALKIEITKDLREQVQKNFSVVLNVENQILKDFAFLEPAKRHTNISNSGKTRKSEKVRSNRTPYRPNDETKICEFLYRKMKEAMDDNTQIFPKGIAIWREYCEEEVNTSKTAVGLQTHFCRYLIKSLYKIRMEKRNILEMYQNFLIEIDHETEKKIERHLSIKLSVNQSRVIVGWEDVVSKEEDDEIEKEEEDEEK